MSHFQYDAESDIRVMEWMAPLMDKPHIVNSLVETALGATNPEDVRDDKGWCTYWLAVLHTYRDVLTESTVKRVEDRILRMRDIEP